MEKYARGSALGENLLEQDFREGFRAEKFYFKRCLVSKAISEVSKDIEIRFSDFPRKQFSRNKSCCASLASLLSRSLSLSSPTFRSISLFLFFALYLSFFSRSISLFFALYLSHLWKITENEISRAENRAAVAKQLSKKTRTQYFTIHTSKVNRKKRHL